LKKSVRHLFTILVDEKQHKKKVDSLHHYKDTCSIMVMAWDQREVWLKIGA
jgi:hypothetical protein